MASVLTSWKEISDHLGKGVRTVQRWEAELGLPVHRSDAKFPRAIFALPQELDAWARSHPLAPATAVVDSLYHEIGALREELRTLSDRLETLESARLKNHLPAVNEAAPGMTLPLRNDLEQSRLALRATIGQSRALREESRAARGQAQATRKRSHTLGSRPQPRNRAHAAPSAPALLHPAFPN